MKTTDPRNALPPTDGRRHRVPEGGGGTKKLTVVNTLLGLATAGLTVLSAYFGVQTAELSKLQKQTEVSAQTADSTVSALQQENQKLRAENDQLKAQTETRGPVVSPTTTTSRPEDPTAWTVPSNLTGKLTGFIVGQGSSRYDIAAEVQQDSGKGSLIGTMESTSSVNGTCLTQLYLTELRVDNISVIVSSKRPPGATGCDQRQEADFLLTPRPDGRVSFQHVAPYDYTGALTRS